MRSPTLLRSQFRANAASALLNPMSRVMTDQQENAIASQSATTAKDNSKQIAEQRRVQDALEDDDVREALKRLHQAREERLVRHLTD